MVEQELIQMTESVIRKNYCNGVALNKDNLIKTKNEIKAHFDYFIPKKVMENDIEYTFYLRLRNVGIVIISQNGEVIKKTTIENFALDSIQKYKELMEKKEKFFIRFFAKNLVNLQQIHISLTPLRKVLRSFIDKDYRIDNLKKNFDYKEIKYINFLKSAGYIRKEGEQYTLDNHYVKRLGKEIKEKEKVVERLTTDIFSEHFTFIISEFSNTSIVPFIGILATLCSLLMELNKRLNVSVTDLYNFYREHYLSGQNERSFEDKVIDMKNEDILEYDEKTRRVTLSQNIFGILTQEYKLNFIQKQIEN